jgi:hypothetical protein
MDRYTAPPIRRFCFERLDHQRVRLRPSGHTRLTPPRATRPSGSAVRLPHPARVELALEIEAELAGTEYDATPNELAAIDEGVVEEAASDTEVKAAFALFRKT